MPNLFQGDPATSKGKYGPQWRLGAEFNVKLEESAVEQKSRLSGDHSWILCNIRRMGQSRLTKVSTRWWASCRLENLVPAPSLALLNETTLKSVFVGCTSVRPQQIGPSKEISYKLLNLIPTWRLLKLPPCWSLRKPTRGNIQEPVRRIWGKDGPQLVSWYDLISIKKQHGPVSVMTALRLQALNYSNVFQWLLLVWWFWNLHSMQCFFGGRARKQPQHTRQIMKGLFAYLYDRADCSNHNWLLAMIRNEKLFRFWCSNVSWSIMVIMVLSKLVYIGAFLAHHFLNAHHFLATKVFAVL